VPSNAGTAVDQWLFGPPFAHFNEVLRREVLPGTRSMLDVGCGRESALAALRGEIPESVGVDIFLPSILESRSLLTRPAALLTERWLEKHPRHAFQLFCVKNLD
jgi:hypothetical protein